MIPNLMLRVFVQGGGCSGLSYGFEFDEAVQDGTRFALYDYELDGRGIELLTARSAREGRGLLAAHPDIAGNLWTNTSETANGIDDPLRLRTGTRLLIPTPEDAARSTVVGLNISPKVMPMRFAIAPIFRR